MMTHVFHDGTGDCAQIIRNGGLVSVPTETVYGLAGDGLNPEAVSRIYEVKGRPSVKPLSLMISGKDDMNLYAAETPQAAEYLAEKYWPGPLTIVLKAKDSIPDIVLAGGKTVGLRCPDHPLTLQLIRESRTALAAPSANLSGGKSPVCAEDVLSVFDGKIEAVIDGGVCTLKKESTLIDLSLKPYRILRCGALSEEEIADALLEKTEVVGITGVSGAGKTSALDYYREKCACVLDCDKLYHDMLSSPCKMLDEILEHFPTVRDDAGFADRKKLSDIVFHDPAELEALNAITHRHIRSEVKRWLREAAMNGCTCAVIDAVELISGGLAEFCNYTVAVLASKENRIQRIMRRDGIDRERAEVRIAAQKSDEYYKENCTYVVYNDAGFEAFWNELNKIDRSIEENGRYEKETFL
jgi:L-threonylcarbamoyladenylate synthase